MLADMMLMSEDMDRENQGLKLGYEAYRDGLLGTEDAQRNETRSAVNGHTEMALRMLGDGMYARSMNDMIGNNKNLQMDLLAKSLGNDIFNSYIDGAYDSSADYWKLMNDGTLVNDGTGWLVDENGLYVNIDGTRSTKPKKGKTLGAGKLDEKGNAIQGSIETGLLNILANSSGRIYDSFSDTEKLYSYSILKCSGFENDDPEMQKALRDINWTEKENKPLNMDLVMRFAGDTVATAVFMNYFDKTTNSMIDGETSISSIVSEYKDSGYLNRLTKYYSAKNEFYNGSRKLFDDYSAVTWTQDMGQPDESTASLYATHKGGDMAGNEGTPVYAFYSGKVDTTYSGSSTSGNSIKLLYGFNFEGSFYSTGVVGQFMHFSEKPTLNNYLSATSQVGKVGHTGLVSGDPGNHLHYQLIGDLQGTEKNSPSWKMLEARRNYFLNKIGSSSKGTYIAGDGYNTYYYDVNFLQKKLNLKRGQ